MQTFQRFDRTTTITIVLVIVSFLLATFDVRSAGGGVGTTMREGVQTLFSPLQDLASTVTRPVVGFIDALSDLASLREENDALRLENEELIAQLDQLGSLEAEVEHLMEINDLEAPGELPTVTARIASTGSSSFDHTRYIDKGADDGISIGDAVIDEQGLVGRVDLVLSDRARVRLILDPKIEVAVLDQSTSQAGLVRGDNQNDLVLRMFAADEPAREGSVILTAGSRFPAGIRVGTITETAADDAGFGLVTRVEPAVTFSRLDYVKVIVGYSPLDAPSIEEELVEEETAEEVPADSTEAPTDEESTTTEAEGSG
jgi:rod shape-determining protein MreC